MEAKSKIKKVDGRNVFILYSKEKKNTKGKAPKKTDEEEDGSENVRQKDSGKWY